MLQKIRFVFFFFDKKDPKLSLSELLSMMTDFNLTRLYSCDLLCEPVLSMRTVLLTINNMWFLDKRESVNAWKFFLSFLNRFSYFMNL